MAVLTGITIHFTFGKENNYFSRKEERTSGWTGYPQREAGKTCPVICVVFQPELEDEELAAEIADMYLHGRAYYYTGKPMPEQSNESPISIKYKDVQWDKLKSIHV